MTPSLRTILPLLKPSSKPRLLQPSRLSKTPSPPSSCVRPPRRPRQHRLRLPRPWSPSTQWRSAPPSVFLRLLPSTTPSERPSTIPPVHPSTTPLVRPSTTPDLTCQASSPRSASILLNNMTTSLLVLRPGGAPSGADAVDALHAQAVSVLNVKALVPVVLDLVLDLGSANYSKCRCLFLVTLSKYALRPHSLRRRLPQQCGMGSDGLRRPRMAIWHHRR